MVTYTTKYRLRFPTQQVLGDLGAIQREAAILLVNTTPHADNKSP